MLNSTPLRSDRLIADTVQFIVIFQVFIDSCIFGRDQCKMYHFLFWVSDTLILFLAACWCGFTGFGPNISAYNCAGVLFLILTVEKRQLNRNCVSVSVSVAPG